MTDTNDVGFAPRRIQRKRTKGWRAPERSVYVGRGSEWGNPFVVGKDGDAAACVEKYADRMMPYRHHGPNSGLETCLLSLANYEAILTLRGKTLMCWCAEGDACHGDWLLRMANDGGLASEHAGTKGRQSASRSSAAG